jgi:hypothetical protein
MAKALFELRVLRLGLLQDGDVGVGGSIRGDRLDHAGVIPHTCSGARLSRRKV